MASKYFFQEDGRAVGPMAESKILELIENGKLRVFDLIFRDGDSSWRMAFEFSEFRDRFKGGPVEALQERPWVCLKRKAEGKSEFLTSGPFSLVEVQVAIREGKISYQDFIWKDGFKEWKRIGSLVEFNPRLKKKTEPPPLSVTRDELLKKVIEIDRGIKRNTSSLKNGVAPPLLEADLPNLVENVNGGEALLTEGESVPSEKDGRSIWDWILVISLVMLVAAAGAIFWNASQGTRVEPPVDKVMPAPEFKTTELQESDSSARQPPPPKVKESPVVPSTLEPYLGLRVEEKQSRKVIFQVRVGGDSASKVRPRWTIKIMGNLGEVGEVGHYEKIVRGTLDKDLELTLPVGQYTVEAVSGSLRSEKNFSVGASEKNYRTLIRQGKKAVSQLLWRERLEFLRVALKMEQEIKRRDGKSINLRPIKFPAHGDQRFLAEQWGELRDIHVLASKGAMNDKDLLARVKKVKQVVSSFSLWR